MRKLTSFRISPREDDFLLQLEIDDELMEVAAAPEVLEQVIVALDELLTDEDDDEETYQKPLG